MDSGDENDDDYREYSRDWEQTDRNLMAEGYREGLDEARNEEVQKYFEIAQEKFLKCTFRLGQLRGICLSSLMASGGSEILPTLKEFLDELTQEVKRIKELRLPETGEFDEFLQAELQQIDQRFACLKGKLLKLEPGSQVHLDYLQVNKEFPNIKPAEALQT